MKSYKNAIREALKEFSGYEDLEHVYFVLSESSGNIKIGKSSDVKSRLHGLQTGDSSKLVFLGSIPFGWLEKDFHAYFSDERVRGEWFSGSSRLWTLLKT